MKHPPAYWHKAKKVLSKRDPVLRKIIKKYNKGFLTYNCRSTNKH